MTRISRREFLVQGGMSLSAAAFLAACGSTAGPTGPGRVGDGDTGDTLPTVELDDVMIARTLQSLHYTVIDVYERLLAGGQLPDSVATFLPTLVEGHKEKAAALADSTGGNSFDCPNPFVEDRYVAPTFETLDTATIADPAVDTSKIAIAFAEWITRSHQDMIASVSDPAMRQVLLAIGADTARQSVALSILAGEAVFNPTITGGDPSDDDENGYPIYYVIPAEFGQLSAVKVVVGEPDAEGQRYSVNLQTPADNSFILPDATCDA